MKRIYPRRIRDKFYLSALLDRYISALQDSPLELRLKALAYDLRIPEAIIRRLMALHRDPDDAPNIHAEDFHILFSNIMFRYPTVKIWADDSGEVFFEL